MQLRNVEVARLGAKRRHEIEDAYKAHIDSLRAAEIEEKSGKRINSSFLKLTAEKAVTSSAPHPF